MDQRDPDQPARELQKINFWMRHDQLDWLDMRVMMRRTESRAAKVQEDRRQISRGSVLRDLIDDKMREEGKL